MELYDHVYQIQSLYGGRNLFQYLFVADTSNDYWDTLLVASSL